MRKYYQVALAITATISLVALLIYRHEYNKLRFVLQVFGYFGNLDEKNGVNRSPALGTSLLPEYRRLTEPMTSWQRLTNEIHIYSAYSISENEIRAIAFAGGSKKLDTMSCQLFYENDNKPISGVFSYNIIESSENIVDSQDGAKTARRSSPGTIYRAYYFICTHGGPFKSGDRKNIAGITFATETTQRYPNNAILLPVQKLHDNNEINNKVSICVAPSALPPVFDMDIIEFLSFHYLLGIRHFIVYNFAIPQRFNDAFSSFPAVNFTYATVPWNFPITQVSPDIVRRIVQADCQYRTYGKADAFVTLTWQEFIVLKYHHTLEKLLQDMNTTGYTADRYKLPTFNFCIVDNEEDVRKNTPNVLGNGKMVDSRAVYIYRPSAAFKKDNEMKTRHTTADVAAVNRYNKSCNFFERHELRSLDDPYVGKFSKNVRNSPIFKLLLAAVQYVQ